MNILLSVLLALITPVKPESGRFTIYQAGQRIGTEEFTITAITGGYRAEGKTELAGDPVAIKSRMELDAQLNPLSYEYTRGTAAIRLKIEKPLSDFEVETVDGQKSSDSFRFPDNGFILDTNFFHHFLLLLYKAGPSGGSFPINVPQDMSTGTAVVRPAGNRTFQIEVGALKGEATTDADGRMLKLSFPDAKVTVER